MVIWDRLVTSLHRRAWQRVRLMKGAMRALSFWREKSDLLVFGSSILWGQGLLEEDKLHQRYRNWLEKEYGERVRVQQFAHSGAFINHPEAGRHSRLHGEVPTPFPTVLEQIARCRIKLRSKVRILIEGGINDVGGARIVSPASTPEEIIRLTEESCYRGVKEMLAALARRFPEAEVYVPGYYQILVPRHLGWQGFHKIGENQGVQLEKDLIDFDDRAVANSRCFHLESEKGMKRAVKEAREELGLDAFFVPSGFLPENGMFGNEVLLFSPWKKDPRIRERARACTSALRSGRTGVHCYLAAAFHPDVRGVTRYLEAIVKATRSRPFIEDRE